MKYVFSLIVVLDIKTARDFYEVLLEQRVKYDLVRTVRENDEKKR